MFTWLKNEMDGSWSLGYDDKILQCSPVIIMIKSSFFHFSSVTHIPVPRRVVVPSKLILC